MTKNIRKIRKCFKTIAKTFNFLDGVVNAFISFICWKWYMDMIGNSKHTNVQSMEFCLS